MSNPYRYMNATEQAMTPGARIVLYNLLPYDAGTNRFGLGEGGQFYLLEAMLADMQAVNLSAQQWAAMAAGYLVGVNGWIQEADPVARVSASQFTVTGANKTSLYKPGRALSVVQTVSGFGWVVTSSYSAGATTVTVVGLDLDTGLSQMWFGQDPVNAPRPPVSSPISAQMFS